MTYALSSWNPVESRRTDLWQNAAAVTLISALAGTGGSINVEQIFKHFGTGSASRSVHDSRVAKPRRGLALELKSIREALRLSVAETAQLFGVSRPTIYSWQNGNPISRDNAARLQAITIALLPHLRLLEEQVGRVAHRAIAERTTLLQMLAAGTNADQAICQLAEILNREAAQRESLARRLQGRNNGSRGSVDLDAFG